MKDAMNKGDMLETLTASFAALKLNGSKRYAADPTEIANMAVRIEAKAKADPTRLAGETLDDLLPN